MQNGVHSGDVTCILPLVAYYGTGRLWLQKRNRTKYKKGEKLNRQMGYMDCIANRPIFISPLNKSDMNRIYYGNNGEIHSSDTTKHKFEYQDSAGKHHTGYTSPEQDIHECLNLNLEKMQKTYSEQNEYMEPYVGIIRWYIEKKLKQL